MYEEDRQAALDMYREMYDSCGDEQALSQFLVSPTRQAVVIARAYNQRERKLQVHSQTRKESLYEDADDVPEYVQAIDGIRTQYPAFQARAAARMEEDALFSVSPAVPAAVPAAEAPAPLTVSAPAEAEHTPEAAPVPVAEASVSQAEAIPAEDISEPQVMPESVMAAADESHGDSSIADPSLELPEELAVRVDPRFSGSGTSRCGVERELSVGLLILYVLVAVPLGLLAVGIMLIPTALFMLLAAFCVTLGVAAVSSAFAGFSIFADLMVVLGVGLVALALGLLFLWLFVWFIGGVIASFISAVIQLGKKLCSREVDS